MEIGMKNKEKEMQTQIREDEDGGGRRGSINEKLKVKNQIIWNILR